MTIKSYKMTEGTLLLGTAPLDISGQVTKCLVNPKENVEAGDTFDVLSGEQLIDDDDITFEFTIEFTLLQDLAAAGVIDWSWDNQGTLKPFVFVPKNSTNRAVSGNAYVVPIAIGGDVKSRPTSDATWRVKGTPVFGVYDPVEEEVTEDV